MELVYLFIDIWCAATLFTQGWPDWAPGL